MALEHRSKTDWFRCDLGPWSVVLKFSSMSIQKHFITHHSDLEHPTLNHDLHAVHRNPSLLVYGLLKGIWRKIRIELDVMDLPGMFYMD